MSLSTFAVTLCAVALFGVVSAHPVCTYRRIQLAIVTNEESCKQACVGYTSNIHGACFAYLYNPRSDDCDGYVFTDDDEYDETTECGPNTGVVLEEPENNTAEPSYSGEYDGCYLYSTALGSALTSEQCAQKCFDLKDTSDYYGGCAAWFYDPAAEECLGVVAEYSSYGNPVCGAVSA